MPSALCSPYWRLAGSDVWRKSFEEFLVCCIAEDAAHCIVAASVPEKFQNLPKFLKIFLQHPHGSICDPEANRPYCTIPRFQCETFDRNLQLATHVKNLAQRKGGERHAEPGMALLNRRRALRGPGGFAVVQYLRGGAIAGQRGHDRTFALACGRGAGIQNGRR